RELAVHHDDAVGADRDRDVAALAFEAIGVVAEIDRLDLDFGEITLLCVGGSRHQDGRGCQRGPSRGRCDALHDMLPEDSGAVGMADHCENTPAPRARREDVTFRPPGEPGRRTRPGHKRVSGSSSFTTRPTRPSGPSRWKPAGPPAY